jgi:CAAX protease family protein
MDDVNRAAAPEPSAPPPEILPPERPSGMRRLFVGPHGIRAGWRFALYVLMFRAVVLILGFLLGPWNPQGTGRLWMQQVIEFGSLLAAVIPAIVMGRIEKHSLGDYGLPRHNAFGKLFWTGAIWGLLSITVLLGGMRGFHAFYVGHVELHGIRILKFAFFWGLFFLLVGLFEEFLFRGYAQFALTAGIGFWPSALLLSALFGRIHLENQGEAWVGALSAGLIGFFFCLTLRRTGNLWFAVGFHSSFDWGETFLYSVPNSGNRFPGHLLSSSLQGPKWLSGGTVGPEGSVLVFVLMAVLWVAFDRMYPEVRYPR